MRHHASHTAFGPSDHRLVTLEKGGEHAFGRYVAGGSVVWLMGFMLMAGWHYATIGTADPALCAAQGLIAVVIAFVIAETIAVARIRITGITFGVAFAIAVIIAEAMFPLGVIVGGIWNSCAGHFPNMTNIARAQLPDSNLE